MTRPNFVFIMTDTQGADMVGCYNRPDLNTPCLDALAGEGVRFDRAYTCSPVCTPARGAIFTGLYPSVNGAYTNNVALADNIVNMGQRFANIGYHTGYIGKWHLDGLDYFDAGTCPEGWDDDYWYDGRRYLADLDAESPAAGKDLVALWRSGLKSIDALREHHITDAFPWAHRISDRGLRFLDEHAGSDEPFVLVCSYDEPHGPSTCPPEYAQAMADFKWDAGPAAHDTLANKPAHHREWAGPYDPAKVKQRFSNPLFFGCNSYVDHEIGRVIEAAKQVPNTWIIYTSDHGDQLGAHRLTGKGPAMYEETTRIPLIVRPPAGIEGGVVNDAPVSHIDLLPTMLKLAGEKVPPILHGRALTDQFAGSLGNHDAAVTMEFTRFAIVHDGWGGLQPIRAIVRGRYKLVINLLYTDELYDLSADPHEMTNLIDDERQAGVRNAMHDELIDRMNTYRDPHRGHCWVNRPWRTDRRDGWYSQYRHRPDDGGYMPQTLAYGTGRPPK